MLSNEGDPMEKITDLLAWGNDVEIVELDKSGHAQQQWLHAHDGHILPVSPLYHSISLSSLFRHVQLLCRYYSNSRCRFSSRRNPTASSLALFENGARQWLTRSSQSASHIPSPKTISHIKCSILSRHSFQPSALFLPTALCFEAWELAMPHPLPRLPSFSL